MIFIVFIRVHSRHSMTLFFIFAQRQPRTGEERKALSVRAEVVVGFGVALADVGEQAGEERFVQADLAAGIRLRVEVEGFCEALELSVEVEPLAHFREGKEVVGAEAAQRGF